ncbi:DUF2142 domain-containing protein [Candidatus Saccharibacteria bacterium]|nr:DUF2142 domain-containing protein [Candidatus Saccharibacteria bacterium]
MVNQKKSLKPIKNFGGDKTKNLALFFCFTIINILFLIWNFKSNSLSFGVYFVVMLIGTILAETALCYILYFAKKHQWKIEKIFLILSLIIGSIYVLVLPIGRVPDEASHFFRVYEITEGHFVSESDENHTFAGSVQPENIILVSKFANQNVTYSEVLNNLGLQASEEKTFIATSAYGYSPLAYTPQIAGMFIGKILHLPFLISAYIAKFFNLFFCITILYLCIKYIPFLKKFIFLLAFLPISMQSMASLSADAPIFVSAIALITFVLYSIYSRKEAFNKKHFFIILALCLFISISKIVYAPLCFILFCIPKERFGGKDIKRKLFWIFGTGTIVVAAYLIWYFISPPTITVSDASGQISLIIHNPIKYFSIVIHSISSNAMMYLSGAFGGYLEWFNIVPSKFYIFLSLIIFIVLCIKTRPKYIIPKDLKILSILLFALISFAIFTAMFVTWTKSGETIIDGVQGRYFLPIMLLIPIWFLPAQRTPIENRNAIIKSTIEITNNYYFYAFFIFESIYVISVIACSHL